MPVRPVRPHAVPIAQHVEKSLLHVVQFAVSLLIDSRYERGLWRVYFWVIWYPLAFWLISMATSVVAMPRAVLKRRGQRATWVSPDRGVRP